METVKSLRDKKYKVRVTHYRKITKNSPYRALADIRSDWGDLDVVLPRGGRTVVEILTPDGREVMGSAKCMDTDNYHRREGINIALERALAKLEA